MPFELSPRILYIAGLDSVLLPARVGGRPVRVLVSYAALARRFGAAGASREQSARLAVLANRSRIEALVRDRLAAGPPVGGELTIE